jgi:hypothetical protein
VIFELAANAVAIVLLGSFAADYIREPRFFIPALVLGIYAVALLATNVAQAVRINAVDYDEPVIAIQTQLERLKAERAIIVKWTLLVAPLMWVPLLVVVLRAFGIDAYAALGTPYLGANALFGIGVIAVASWFSMRYSDRLRRSGLLRSVADILAGRSLADAVTSLETIRRFEEE